MECNDLITFNTNDNLSDLNSPLIPLPDNFPGQFMPRMSDVTNPFDNILRKALQHPLDATIVETKEEITSFEDKENIQSLVSPYKTPIKNKKQIKISTTPIYLGENKVDNKPIVRKDFESIINFDNSSGDHNNSSIQLFDESFLNDTLNCALIASNTSFLQENSKIIKDNDSVDNKSTEIIQRLKNVQRTSFSSFNTESFLNQNEISKISSTTSCYGDNPFDKGFVLSCQESQYAQPFRRRCASASKPQRPKVTFDYTAKRQLNNSFGGFEADVINLQNDIIYEESIKAKKKGDVSIVQAALDAAISIDNLVPPWLEDELILSNDEKICEEIIYENKILNFKSPKYDPLPRIQKKETNTQVQNDSDDNSSFEKDEKRCSEEDISPVTTSPENMSPETKMESVDPNNSFTFSVNKDVSFEINGNDVKIINNKQDSITEEKTENVNDLIKNIKDLLHNESMGKTCDRKKLGESLLNAFAIALELDNLVTPQKSPEIHENNCVKNQKTENTNTAKGKINFIKNVEPKIKMQPMKNLRLKNENKGPLKAVIPVKNMEKTKKSILTRNSTNISSTPPRTSSQLKKTSTPIWPVSRKPQAQSTPNVVKPSPQSSITPTRYQGRSSLPKPSSTTDLSRCMSPRNVSKNSSGSVPNLSSTGQSVNNSLTKPSNLSMLRRKSASDLKQNTNKILEAPKEAKKSNLKRSFSFQSKNVK